MYHYEKKDRKSLGAQTEDELMKYILQEPIKPGQKIPNEFELAEKFGVGRSTVREAVKGLVSRGILEVRRGSGTYVINTNSLAEDPLGFGKIEDKYELALQLFEVRLMIEPEIASIACKNASEEDLLQLKKLCDETEELYLGGHNHIKKDIEFHTFIAKCSKNQVVELLLPVIHTAVLTFANVTHRLLRDETIRSHRAITEAILARDSVGARCAMITHLTYNRQTIMKIICERNSKDMEKHLTFKRTERRLKKVYGHNVQKQRRLFLEIIAFFCVKNRKEFKYITYIDGKNGESYNEGKQHKTSDVEREKCVISTKEDFIYVYRRYCTEPCTAGCSGTDWTGNFTRTHH